MNNIHALIKKLRSLHNYSQEDLAKLINVSRPTFAKIEAGEAELTISQAQELARAFKITLENFLAGKESSSPEYVIAPRNGVITKTCGKSTMRIAIPQEKIDKFKEVLLYILEKVGAKPTVGEGVLCKLLYFIDFDYYEKYEEQLIGAIYIKNHYGPTPLCFPKVVKKMEGQQELIAVAQKYFTFQQKKYLPLRKPNLTVLSAQEVEHIDWVLARLADKNAKEMEEYSHRDVPWIIAENQQPIDYESVFYRTAEFSVREYGDEEV